MRLNYFLGSSAALLVLGLGTAASAQTAEPYAPPPQPGQQPAYAQPGQDPQQPYQAQPGQPYPGQPYQVQPGQPYPGQPYQVQPGQPYPGQPYQAQPYPGQPGQPGYYQPGPRRVVGYRTQPRYGLIIAGSVVLGVSWLVTIGATAIAQSTCNYTDPTLVGSCPYTYWPTYIPILGPFIEMAYVPIDGSQNLARFGLAVAGLAQTSGLIMLAVGAATRHRLPVYAQRYQVGPLIASSGSGLMVSGRF